MAERKVMGDNDPVIQLHYNTQTVTLVTDEQVSVTTNLNQERPIKELIELVGDIFNAPNAILGEIIIDDSITIQKVQTLLSKIIK